MNTPITKGTHHVGLTVSNPEDSADFFISILGWREVGRSEEYHAIYVSDDSTMVTLWKIKEAPAVQFNKNKNIGLHHLAFYVNNEDDLKTIHGLLKKNKIKIEFAPELLRQGPEKHMMCYEPSGIRIEFIWPGN